MNNQNQDDTIELLNECDAGVRMAVEAINEILPAVKDPAMQKEVQHCLEQHRKTGEQTAVQLHQHNCEGKSPSPIARGMSWLRTNVKLSMDDSDAAAADLLTDGCNMGVKTLTQFKNQYSAADSAAQKLADDIIHSEQQLADGLRSYL